jgi:hypothetical protein
MTEQSISDADAAEDCRRTAWNLIRLTNKCREYDFVAADFTVREVFRTAKCDAIFTPEAVANMHSLRSAYAQKMTPERLQRLLNHAENNTDRVIADRTARALNVATHSAAFSCLCTADKMKYYVSPSAVVAKLRTIL